MHLDRNVYLYISLRLGFNQIERRIERNETRQSRKDIYSIEHNDSSYNSPIDNVFIYKRKRADTAGDEPHCHRPKWDFTDS